jgi:hypothetical protein
LVGKIGGSIAESTGLHDFVVGSFCIIEVPAEKKGPLYLTINDLPSGFADNAKKVRVGIHAAELPVRSWVDVGTPTAPEPPADSPPMSPGAEAQKASAEPPSVEKADSARLLATAGTRAKAQWKVKATVTGLRYVSRLAVASQEIRMLTKEDPSTGKREDVILDPPTITAHVSGKGLPTAEVKLELEINGKKKDQSFKMEADNVAAKKLEFKYSDFVLPE